MLIESPTKIVSPKLFTFFSFICLLIIYGCGQDKVSQPPRFYLEKYDSILVPRVSCRLLDYDTLRSKAYFYFPENDSILILNTKLKTSSGFKLKPITRNETKLNYQVGVFDDSLLVVSNINGLFLYNAFGNLKDSMPLDKGYNYSNWERVYSFRDSSNHIKFVLPFAVKEEQGKIKYSPRNEIQFYKNYKALTVIDWATKIQRHEFGYPSSSILLKGDYYYPARHSLYKVEQLNRSLYILYNPDPVVYVFSLDDYSQTSSVRLEPEHFELREKLKFKGVDWGNLQKLFLINSQYNYVGVCDGLLLACYSTGVPTSSYERVKSETQFQNLFQTENKNYLQVFHGSTKQGGDIQLPNEVFSIALLKSSDCILGEPNEFYQKFNDKFKAYYIYRLKPLLTR